MNDSRMQNSFGMSTIRAIGWSLSKSGLQRIDSFRWAGKERSMRFTARQRIAARQRGITFSKCLPVYCNQSRMGNFQYRIVPLLGPDYPLWGGGRSQGETRNSNHRRRLPYRDRESHSGRPRPDGCCTEGAQRSRAKAGHRWVVYNCHEGLVAALAHPKRYIHSKQRLGKNIIPGYFLTTGENFFSTIA